MPTDDYSAGLNPPPDEAIEIECPCEYPHGHDFEPPFESCTCAPDCFHIVPLNLEELIRHES